MVLRSGSKNGAWDVRMDRWCIEKGRTYQDGGEETIRVPQSNGGHTWGMLNVPSRRYFKSLYPLLRMQAS